MRYVVIEAFFEPDHQRQYHPGQHYPGLGHTATPERIAYLSGNKNRIGKPLIQVEKMPDALEARYQPKSIPIQE